MNIGLYFGSFNPIHHGHLIIATHILNNSDLDEIWFVVSPQNPLKKSGGLLNEQHRLNLVRAAIEGESKLKASNIEFKLPRPSYTIDTLTHLKDRFAQHEFSIIMGSDAFMNIEKWKNYQALLANYPIYIYNRPGFEISTSHHGNIVMMDAPLLEISSTHIRELIRKKKNIRYLVPDAVRDQIETHQYYASGLENPS
jgi:nicotinate-nucleotide adenylyltransferase